MKTKATLLALFVFALSFGQNSNKFLDRKFWKTNPTKETVDKLISEGNSITEKNRHSMDALSYAILENTSIETIKHVLAKGIDVNTLTHDKRTYIFWAGYKNNYELMKFLLSKGAKTDLKDSHGYSLIQFITFGGVTNTNIYKLCMENGLDINQLDKKGRNIAHLYAQNMKDVKMLDFFQKNGVDIYSKDKNGNGVFTYAAKTKNQEILEGLVKKGFDYKDNASNTENAFLYATAFSHRGSGKKLELSLLNYLENLGLNPAIVNKDNNSPLHNVAFSSKNPEIISYFIDKGLDVNLSNKKGNTPFMNASYMNTKEVLNVFLKDVKNINQQNKDGETALTIAVRRNKPEIVDYLIEKGADITIKDKKGNNLLFHLVDAFRGKKTENFKDKFKLLVAKGLKPTKDDDALLHYATKKGKLAIVKELLAMGMNVNSTDKNGFSPLHIAVMTAKNTKIVEELINGGADKSLKTVDNETPYDLAAENEMFKNKNVDITFLK